MTFFPTVIQTDKRPFHSTRLIFHLKTKKRLMLKLNNSSVQMLLLGLCVGVTLGIAFVPIDLNFGCSKDPGETVSLKLPVVSAEIESPVPPPPSRMSPPEMKNLTGDKFRRPRYFSTELGLRRKLVAGIILSSNSYLEGLIQINQTLSQRVDKLLFFVSEGAKVQLKTMGLNGVIELPSGESHKGQISLDEITLKVIKYFGERFGEGYDHFFLSLDRFYVHGRLLMDLLGRISISQDFMWGVPGRDTCILEHGFVISRRLIQKLSMKVDRCLTSPILSNNLTKCFRFALNGNLPCESTVQNLRYTTANPKKSSEEISSALTIGPLNSISDFQLVHSQISKSRLAAINSNIIKLQRSIHLLQPKLPPNFQSSSWPIGLPSGFIPKTRFDVLRWTFFDGDSLYFKNDQLPIERIGGIDTKDLNHITNTSKRYIQNVGGAVGLILEGGYRRFNPTRGMEYVLDFRERNNKLYRVQGLRPLCQMELVPMPFVTENQRVTIIVPIINESTQEVKGFLDRFFNFSTDLKLNTVLIFIILTSNGRGSGERFLTERDVKEVQKLISYYNGKIPKKVSDRVKAGYMLVPKKKLLPLSLLNGVEAVINRIMGTSALIVVVDVHINLKDEFLNRVRMNTILNTQVFSPIPFVEHNPSIYLGKGASVLDSEIEINKNSGYFDPSVFKFFSFYAADFIAARRKLSAGNLTEFQNFQDLSSLPHLFVKFTSLFLLRSPEPSLKIPFAFPNGCSSFEDCAKSRWGTRAQLAKMILNSIPKAKPD